MEQLPLHDACRRGHIEIVEYLVEHGANVNVSDNDGITPLHDACRGGHKEIVEYLVEHGANVNVSDNDEQLHFTMRAWKVTKKLLNI